jgi:Holliday junction resolvase RusA-like endonuclease
MKPRVEFVVPGIPVPAARPRVVPLYGKGKKLVLANGRPILRAYTEEATEEYEQRCAFSARAALQRYPSWIELALSEAVFRLHLHFIRPAARGDLDNFVKAAMDGLKKGNVYRADPKDLVRGKPRQVFIRGLFRDDARIVQLAASMHTDPKAEPRTEVLLETATMVLEEPLWMRCARERGWRPAASDEVEKQEEATHPTIGASLER